MPRCTKLASHAGDCKHDDKAAQAWLIMPENAHLRCDFHIVVMPYNDFLDKFETRDE